MPRPLNEMTARRLAHPYRIRKARPEDLAALGRIEERAATLFAEVGLAGITAGDATSIEDFLHCQQADLLWVAVGADDEPVGFAFVELIEGQPHLDELDVDPRHGRHGIGRALVQAVIDWARGAVGYRRLTLTTFRDVPWNMPFYASLGFVVLPAEAQTSGLRALVDAETERGLPQQIRVVMALPLAPAVG